MLLKNGKIYVERGTFVRDLLIEDGMIVKAGELDNIDDEEVIDLEGRTVVPGFNDSHLHLIMNGYNLNQPDLKSAKSLEDLIDKCRRFIEENPETVKNGMFASGWNQDFFLEDKRIPTRFDMDRISTEIPVVLRRTCAHIACANTLAVKKLGIDGSSEQFDGGRFTLGEDGEPDGVFYEGAVKMIMGVIQKPDMTAARKFMLDSMNNAVSLGVTSVQSNDLGTFYPNTPVLREMIDSAFSDGVCPVRYHYQAAYPTPDDFLKDCEAGLFSGSYRDSLGTVTMGDLKLFKDGTLGARTALMTEDYADMPGEKGTEVLSDEDLCRYIDIAEKYGVRICIHTIGDEAARRTIDCFERHMTRGNPLRHGIIHYQITDREIIEKTVTLGLGVQYQPIFLNYDMHIVESRVGKELASTSYAFGTFSRLGGDMSFSTDCPVESLNPFTNIYSAVTRKDLSGYPEEGWNPGECLDVETCIDAYTVGSARCQFQENYKGRLKEGFAADLTVLDKDIFTCDPMEIKDIRPVMTISGGRIVYRR